MTQDEIIEMYLEVSNKLCNGTEWCWAGVGEPLQLFAKLVAEKEREACAEIKNILHPMNFGGKQTYTIQELLDHMKTGIVDYSNAIRARGQA
jgi:hypothetical protein